MAELKQGVKLLGLTPQMCVAFVIINSIYDKYNYECTITSCTDGIHGVASKHKVGNALDIRSHNLDPTSKPEILHDIKVALGAEFDVIIENLNQNNEHIHVEWDPK